MRAKRPVVPRCHCLHEDQDSLRAYGNQEGRPRYSCQGRSIVVYHNEHDLVNCLSNLLIVDGASGDTNVRKTSILTVVVKLGDPVVGHVSANSTGGASRLLSVFVGHVGTKAIASKNDVRVVSHSAWCHDGIQSTLYKNTGTLHSPVGMSGSGECREDCGNVGVVHDCKFKMCMRWWSMEDIKSSRSRSGRGNQACEFVLQQMLNEGGFEVKE